MYAAVTQPTGYALHDRSEMTVYAKTSAGRLRAFSQKPDLIPALRDLLRRVDGKTPYFQLIQQPGDIELFDELYGQQLVQVAAEPWRSSAFTRTPEALLSSREHRTDTTAVQPFLSLVSNTDTRHDSKIQTVKVLMTDFIQAQLPQHADATFAEINALTSEAQLLCMLSGYFNLVNPCGQSGQEHVQQLMLALAGPE